MPTLPTLCVHEKLYSRSLMMLLLLRSVPYGNSLTDWTRLLRLVT